MAANGFAQNEPSAAPIPFNPHATTSEPANVSESDPANTPEPPPPAPVQTTAPAYVHPASAQEASAPVDVGTIGFSQLRGLSYNSTAGNIAAGTNVQDLLIKPNLFSGKNFFYVNIGETEEQGGLLSWGEGELKWILGYRPVVNKDNWKAWNYDGNEGGEMGLLNFGLANSYFGLLLNLSLGKIFQEDNNGSSTTSTDMTEPGDIFGLVFSLPIGSLILNADIAYHNHSTSTNDNLRKEISVSAGIGNGLTEGNFFWEVGLSLNRFNDNNDGNSLQDEARTEITPYFNLAYVALKNERARAMWGFNNAIVGKIYDEIVLANTTYGHNEVGLIIKPNLLGEVLITKNVIAFGEIAHNLKITYEKTSQTPRTGSEISDTEIAVLSRDYDDESGTEASVGLRGQHKNFAIEAVLANKFYNNVFNSDWTKGALSAFIYF
jgi:hypothetical protein